MNKDNFGSYLRSQIVGANTEVPVNSGGYVTAVNFDNAATTPPLCSVMNEIVAFAPWYSSVHRGKGYKSVVTSELYEQARQTIRQFVRAKDNDVVVFTKSTTESINLLANILGSDKNDKVIIATDMEHLANDLPWRRSFPVDYACMDSFGRLSLKAVEDKLQQHQGNVALVAVTGASNVTGYINPVHSIARLAHKYGAKIFVDGAQLVPHMPFCMNTGEPLERIDFLAFSAHKMYAPFGTGVLVGNHEELDKAEPLLWGGGAVDLTSHQFIEWDAPPGRYEAGTPNVMGVLALVTAINNLENIGLAAIHQYEGKLISVLIAGLSDIPGVQLYSVPKGMHERVSLISFLVDGIDHGLLAQTLSQEAGIAVRNGLFCAHPYVEKLLKIGSEELNYYHTHDDAPIPGLVRVSLGLYNNGQEVELFLRTVQRIAANPAYFVKKYQDSMRKSRCSYSRQSDFC